MDGEVLEDDPSSIVDTVLDGQYQVEAMLGKGGMGAVYRARHILLGDRVAIKVLPPEVRTNAEWLRRFRREGQAARRFRHPNAVTVYDLRTAGDGTIYMVMEYVEGHTLSQEIKTRGPVTPAEAFAVLEPIMSVLNTAHEMGVVHRDLKPENIMIGKAGGAQPVVKLLDLGIAKMRELAGADGGGNTALTMAGQVLGTPHYMSPEQWGELSRDGDSEIDGRADIYSLGLVFYEMIVGRRPYAGMTLHELRREHISVTPPLLHEVVPGISRAFSEVIARATSKDRADRQATAGEFAAQLRAAISTMPLGDYSRTVPDLPRVQLSSAQTADVPKAVGTKSDLDAPTIITVDSPATAPGAKPPGVATSSEAPTFSGKASQAVPVSEPQPYDAVVPGATVASSAGIALPSAASAPDMVSSVTIPQSLKSGVTAKAPSHRPIIAAGAGALVLILLVVGVGGFFAVKWLTAKNGTDGTNVTENKNSPANGSAGVAKDLGRYWLEVLPESVIGEPVRVAGVVPLASGQSFKFHFIFREGGYLYIVGPGEGSLPTAFLTAKPPAISGLENNQVNEGTDFSFPSGLEHWLQLDKNPGTEDYSIIFSPAPLAEPKFFSGQATGKPLTQEEQMELTSFLAKYKANEPIVEVDDKNTNEPFVKVNAPKSASAGNPFVFEIRIQHK